MRRPLLSASFALSVCGLSFAQDVQPLLGEPVRGLTPAELELFLEGLWWSVASDLIRGGIQLPESSTGARLYQATIDQLWFNARLTPLALREPIDQEGRRALEARGWGLPNQEHPSDHLSIGGVFRLSPHGSS